MTMQSEDAETQPDELAEAKQALADAERKVGETEQALLDSAAGVAPGDLVAAEEEAVRRRSTLERFKGIIRIRNEREAERKRQAAIVDLRRRVKKDLADRDLADIIERFDAAVASLVPLITAIHDRNQRHRDARQTMRQLGPLPADFHAAAVAGSITVDGLVVEPVNLADLAAEVVWRAIRQAIPNPGSEVTHQTADLRKAARVGPSLQLAQRYGVEVPNPRYALVGPSDRLRWLAGQAGAQR